MLLLGVTFSCLQLLAQQRTITGKVTDPNGSPIANASVIVKQSAVGTTTDATGEFKLTIPASAKTLVVSSVGFAPFEISVGNKTMFAITLTANSAGLEEVIFTGVKTIKKAEYAGAVSRVSRKNIEDRPVGSFDQLLQGQVSGLLAVTTSGQPGTSANITIRGSGSIAGGTNPLYVVDGIPVEATVFQALNPNDFESVDVLKDASASALYGSRGSAGVIVVTTKRGTAQKMKLSYSLQMGVKDKPEFAYHPMTTAELLKAQEDYGKIAGGGSIIPGWYYSKNNPRYATLTPTQQTAATAALDSISKINTDWSDYIFRNGPFSNHQISLSGGSGKTRVYSSLELYNEDGLTKRTDMQRISLRNNIDYADEKLTFSLSSSIAYVKRNFQQSTTTNSTGNPFLAVNIASPYSLVYKPDGSFATGTGAAYVGANQMELTALDKNYNNQIKVLLGTTTSYKVTNDITAAVTAGVDFRETQATNYGSKLAYTRVTSTTPTGKAGFQLESLNRYFQADVRPSVSYKKTFDKHKVDVGVYGEYIKQYTKNFSLTGYGIDPRTPNTPAAITQGDAVNQLFANVGGGLSQNTLLSGLGIASYTYNDRYTLTGSYRYDGSSRLPKKNEWQGFYSVGAVWNITKEDFLANNRIINNLNFRASYGGSGDNDNFPAGYGDYGYYPSYAANGNYSGLTTLYVSNIGYPDMNWEKTYILNLGLDFSILNNRVYGSFEVYDKRTKGLFVQRQLAAEGTGAAINVNGGELQNKGIEADVSFDLVRNRTITWTINGKLAYNKNNVLNLGGLSSYPVGTSLVTVGVPLGSHYEVRWAGVDAATGAPLYVKKDGKTITSTYSADDKVQQFGTYEAPWKGGFGSSVRYKDFDLSVLFSWQRGATKEDNLEYFVENPAGFLANGYNQSSSMVFWKKPGDVASTPSPLYSTNFSSKLIHDASFLRLRDVTLYYTLPQNLASKTRFISKARIYVQGSNLLIWTKWRGMDPEAGPVNINLSEFPNPRAFTAGLDISF